MPKPCVKRQQRRHARGQGQRCIGHQTAQGLDRRGAKRACEQFALRRQSAAMAGRREQTDQLRRRGLGKVEQRLRGVALRRQANQKADVLADVAKDRPVPTRRVNVAVGIDVEIGHAVDAQEFLLIGREGRAVGLEVMTEDHAAAPVGRVGRGARVGGKAGFVEI